jgi:hypothetical protein
MAFPNLSYWLYIIFYGLPGRTTLICQDLPGGPATISRYKNGLRPVTLRPVFSNGLPFSSCLSLYLIFGQSQEEIKKIKIKKSAIFSTIFERGYK